MARVDFRKWSRWFQVIPFYTTNAKQRRSTDAPGKAAKTSPMLGIKNVSPAIQSIDATTETIAKHSWHPNGTRISLPFHLQWPPAKEQTRQAKMLRIANNKIMQMLCLPAPAPVPPASLPTSAADLPGSRRTRLLWIKDAAYVIDGLKLFSLFLRGNDE